MGNYFTIHQGILPLYGPAHKQNTSTSTHTHTKQHIFVSRRERDAFTEMVMFEEFLEK